MNIYLDIETIPSQQEAVKIIIAEGIAPPGNIKKPESVEKWMAEKKEMAVNEKLHKTGLDGTYGEIICMAAAVDDNPVECVYREIDGSEAELLTDFYNLLLSFIGEHQHPAQVTWIGHNITGFDLRFIWNRSVINNIKPSIKLPYDTKPWGETVYDTMIAWAGNYQSSTSKSLDAVSRAFGLEGKGDIDGSKVWEYVQAGKLLEVVEYCKRDVEAVRLLYKRMMFL